MALCLSLSKFINSRQNVILNLLILPSLSNEFMEEYSAPTWSLPGALIIIIIPGFCPEHGRELPQTLLAAGQPGGHDLREASRGH